jgi:hypothetical protein
MKPISITFFVVFFLAVAVANGQKAQTIDYVNVTVGEDNATSELLRMPLGADSSSSIFDIGIMYFGPGSDSDLSAILYVKTSQARYSSGASYGVKLFIDDIPLRSNYLRGVSKVVNEKGFDRLHFHLKREELAWLATGESLRIEIFDVKTEKIQDTVSFAKPNLAEFKRFAKSVLLIISTVD